MPVIGKSQRQDGTFERAAFAFDHAADAYTCPKARACKILRSMHEGARDMARDLATTEAYVTFPTRAEEGRDPVRSPQAHPQARRLRLRGPNGARDEFLLAATAKNFRKLAKLFPLGAQTVPPKGRALCGPPDRLLIARPQGDFLSAIRQKATSFPVRFAAAPSVLIHSSDLARSKAILGDRYPLAQPALVDDR